MKKQLGVIGISVMILLIGGGSCSDESSSEPNWIVDGSDLRQTVLQSLASTVIIPRYQKFKAETILLKEAAEALCSAPSEDQLQSVRTQWESVRDLWKASEVTRFGPYAELPLRIGPKIDFWPARPDKIEDLLQGMDPIDALLLNNSGTTVRGLPVSEYLLYGPQFEDVLEEGHRRCSFVMANAEDIINSSDILIQAWSPQEGMGDKPPSFGWNFANAGSDQSRFMDPHEAVNEVVNRMIFAVEDVRVLKLGKPVGDSTGGNPVPDRLESPYAQRSLQDSIQAIRGIHSFFYAEFEGNKGQGIVELLRGKHPDIISRFDQTYAAGIDALEAIEGPLAVAITDHRDQVKNAQTVLRDLQVVLQVELAQVLNVSPRFNDNDGD